MSAEDKKRMNNRYIFGVIKGRTETPITALDFGPVVLGGQGKAYSYQTVRVGVKYPIKDKEEVGDYCYKSIAAIKESLASHKDKYTTWFAIAFPLVEKWIAEQAVIKEVA